MEPASVYSTPAKRQTELKRRIITQKGGSHATPPGGRPPRVDETEDTIYGDRVYMYGLLRDQLLKRFLGRYRCGQEYHISKLQETIKDNDDAETGGPASGGTEQSEMEKDAADIEESGKSDSINQQAN